MGTTIRNNSFILSYPRVRIWLSRKGTPDSVPVRFGELMLLKCLPLTLTEPASPKPLPYPPPSALPDG